jgi:hypothetical protein
VWNVIFGLGVVVVVDDVDDVGIIVVVDVVVLGCLIGNDVVVVVRGLGTFRLVQASENGIKNKFDFIIRKKKPSKNK